MERVALDESDHWKTIARDDGMPDEFGALLCLLVEGHISSYGGYPLAWEWFGETLVIADLDPSKDRVRTMLIVYERHELLAWVKEAKAYATEHDIDLLRGYDMDLLSDIDEAFSGVGSTYGRDITS